jgi:putative peptide zinc metalloprotease protein
VIIWVILLFVFDLSLVVGTILASVAAVGWIGVPVVKALRELFFSPRLRRSRGRAWLFTLGPAALAVFFVFGTRLPFHTLAEGVVWVPDEALVRAGTPGFVERLLAEPGSRVRTGQPLVECSDPDLLTQAAVHRARLRGLEVRYRETRLENLARAEVLAEEIHHLGDRLRRIEQRLEELTLRAGRDGIFVVPLAEDLPGRFVKQGDLLAYVVEQGSLHVRAVVAQENFDLVRDRLHGVSVRRAERLSDVYHAQVLRLVPAARPELPSVALGSEGGGAVAVDPRDTRGTSAVQPLFEVELEMPNSYDSITVGNRVHLRFSHGSEALAWRWYRSLRQLFLSRFDV